MDTLDIPFEVYTDVDSASVASSISSARAYQMKHELEKLESELSLVVNERDKLRSAFVETEMRHRKSLAELRARIAKEQPDALSALDPALADAANTFEPQSSDEEKPGGDNMVKIVIISAALVGITIGITLGVLLSGGGGGRGNSASRQHDSPRSAEETKESQTKNVKVQFQWKLR